MNNGTCTTEMAEGQLEVKSDKASGEKQTS